MTDEPDWLPPLVLFESSGGDWEAYLDVVFDWFTQDFVDDKPLFQGRRLGLKRKPVTQANGASDE